MNKLIFASDIDNTIMFSYKHRMECDICIEILDGKEQGFCTPNTFALLEQISKKALFIPITTRSMEQYKRIGFPKSCMPQYALTTNGAILLVNGAVDTQWYAESRQIADTWKTALSYIENQLPNIQEIKRFRMVDDMYLFAACDNAEEAEKSKLYFDGKTDLDVVVSGRKIYFFPPMLDKGTAIDRLRKKFLPSHIISAGDSSIDIPMFDMADVSIFIKEYAVKNKKVICYHGNIIRDYTKFVLEQVLQEIDENIK